MDGLTALGLFAVTAMLVCYALEMQSAWFILAFAGACALGSVYGFLQGAWPFGLVEAVWALARDLLTHASLTTTNAYYNKARSMEASRHYAGVLEQLRSTLERSGRQRPKRAR